MNKKEVTIAEWVRAFEKGTSFWKESVHVDELVGKKKSPAEYFSKAFILFSELIARAAEAGLTKKYNLCLCFYLRSSPTLEVGTPETKQLWSEFSHTPPELRFIKRAPFFESGLTEYYEMPLSLTDLDAEARLGSYKEELFPYYCCWRSREDENESETEYQRLVIVEFRCRAT